MLKYDNHLTAKEYLKELLEQDIDSLVLGCTHYPIYEDIIREELKYEVELINTGITVSKYLKKYLKENNLEKNGQSNNAF